MLKQIFMQIIEMSNLASFIILFVLLIRIVLKKFPKFVSYLLWFVVLFRLLCPISFESAISLIPNVKPISYYFANEQMMDVYTKWRDTLVLFGKYIWLIGFIGMIVYNIVSYFRICRKVSTAIPLRDNVYIVDNETSPFVMGVIHPKIYLPDTLDASEREYIIMHEKFHINRLDHVVKALAFIALSVHWFNPLVWIAFILSTKDMEMSCDEAVIKRKGQSIKADYAVSLLSLTIGRRIIPNTSLAFGEGDTKERIKNLSVWQMPNQKHLSIGVICVFVLIICLMANPIPKAMNFSDIFAVLDNENTTDTEVETLPLDVNIEDHYVTGIFEAGNTYYIDKNNVLWGCGYNEFAQLGLGTYDFEYYPEMNKIAEDVIHVDYSQNGFLIYITKDYKLYGLGNYGPGALLQYDTFDWSVYNNYLADTCCITEPILLMKDVIFACCGRSDIVCILEDRSVWTWGTMYTSGGIGGYAEFVPEPTKILENALLVTGGFFNHAALLDDGSVWTWGNNFTGNCGVEFEETVKKPTKVADNVVMVWTGAMRKNTGSLEELKEMAKEEYYPRHYENTLIQKVDGTYWVCGINVGKNIKLISDYYEVRDVYLECTHEFFPLESTNVEFTME